MSNTAIFAIIVVAAFALVILFVEISERKSKGVKTVECIGTITKISERPAFSARALFKWDALVSFEYEGTTYTVAVHLPNKPRKGVGDTVNVTVNTKNPADSSTDLM